MFFGGGTPSLLTARAIDDVLAAIRARLPLAPDAEVTLEANPGTFEAEKFTAFRAAGVNRLSVGIQSFHPRHLQALGRIHDDREARRAIEIAQAIFDDINLDVMYGLPGQTLEEARADIETAASFGTAHLSAYHLTIEPNTYFHRYPPQLPEDDLAADMQQTGRGDADGPGLLELRDVRLRETRPRMPPQPQLLAFRRLSGNRRRRARQDLLAGSRPCAKRGSSTRGSTWTRSGTVVTSTWRARSRTVTCRSNS